jgi:hypothetical protein
MSIVYLHILANEMAMISGSDGYFQAMASLNQELALVIDQAIINAINE